MGKESLKTIRLGLINQFIAIRNEKDIPRLVSPQEDIDDGHACSGFSGSGCHDNQSFSFTRGEGLAYPTNRFVLIGSVSDRIVDRNA